MAPDRAQGYAPNQKLVLMSDGGESVRRLVGRVGPETEHVLNWFHVTMRLTVLRQMAKGAYPADAAERNSGCVTWRG